MEHTEPQEHQTSEYGLHRCAAHPEVETGLSCGRCGTYICPRCMVQTPVGARCNNCARVAKHPTLDVQPRYYIRASLAGGLTAIAAGLVWGVLWGLPIPFLAWFLALGVGYVVGEAISVASNRKRGTGLSVIAGVSMALAVAAAGFFPSASPISIIFWLVMVGGAYYMAINRVR